ncbi:conserved hypothetical protein [Culex quinquefasciatus]|uniref:Uncharacterized protein n=1 Tax=Culex quinquefasciatus TaxID=7176 RepID=B0WD91_CULQU|nr:conserved hypothetical protein [Culex quinquefasciatus]|eukprot:XP_001846696.1 conserved hypothetical protein [Culex quinquefasciatus]
MKADRPLLALTVLFVFIFQIRTGATQKRKKSTKIIGVVSGEVYVIRFEPDPDRLLADYSACGEVFVFLSAAKLSDNALFYYICGICLGIFASFLVVFYLTIMIFPRKPIMYGVMLEGWKLKFYSAYREATTGFCIALFICCYFPRTLLTRVCSLYRRRFPLKRRLLTVEEFNEPGAREVCGPAIGHEWTRTGSSSSSWCCELTKSVSFLKVARSTDSAPADVLTDISSTGHVGDVQGLEPEAPRWFTCRGVDKSHQLQLLDFRHVEQKLDGASSAARSDEISLHAAPLAAQDVVEKSHRITTARTPAEAAYHRRKPLHDPRNGCLVGTLSPGRIENMMLIPVRFASPKGGRYEREC